MARPTLFADLAADAESFGLRDADDERELRRSSERCTPELLLAFCRKVWRASGRSPTMFEIKHEFGGILGAMVYEPELKRAGLLLPDGKPKDMT